MNQTQGAFEGEWILQFMRRIFQLRVSPVSVILLGAIVLLVYLNTRNAGLVPMVFGDEWMYNLFSRVEPASLSPRPMYLFFYVYGWASHCGEGFLDCARQINALFFALSLPLIYSVSRSFLPVGLSLFVAICSVFSPINTYSAFFMPESMYFFFFWLFTWVVVKGFESNPLLMTLGGGGVLGLMSMVKPHAVFLFPALLVGCFFPWLQERTFPLFKRGIFLSLASGLAFLAVRFPVGYLLAGTNGLSIMGSDYTGYARHALSMAEYITLLSNLRSLFIGHLLGALFIVGIPLMVVLHTFLRGSQSTQEPLRKFNFLVLYTGILYFFLLVIIVGFTAEVVIWYGIPVRAISMRHYSFMFPLFFIIVAASIRAPIADSHFSGIRFKVVSIVMAIMGTYGLIAFNHWASPSIVDCPELLAFHSNAFWSFMLGAGVVFSLALTSFQPKRGMLLYLFVVVPLLIVASSHYIAQSFLPAIEPSAYDQAGRFVNWFLKKDVSKLIVIGNDQADVNRANFYLSSTPLEFRFIPNGQPLAETVKYFYSNQDAEWMLLIGPYSGLDDEKYPYDAVRLVDVPARKDSYRSESGFALFHKSFDSRKCFSLPADLPQGGKTLFALDMRPNIGTPHTTGKFDPTSSSMVAKKGEAGALIFGPSARLKPGCYEATYRVLAQNTGIGEVVGRIDISANSRPGEDNVVMHQSVRSGNLEQSMKFIFKVTNPELKYQFRVWSNGVAKMMKVRRILVKRLEFKNNQSWEH